MFLFFCKEWSAAILMSTNFCLAKSIDGTVNGPDKTHNDSLMNEILLNLLSTRAVSGILQEHFIRFCFLRSVIVYRRQDSSGPPKNDIYARRPKHNVRFVMADVLLCPM